MPDEDVRAFFREMVNALADNVPYTPNVPSNFRERALAYADAGDPAAMRLMCISIPGEGRYLAPCVALFCERLNPQLTHEEMRTWRAGALLGRNLPWFFIAGGMSPFQCAGVLQNICK